ncbi:MAG: hypothetical protein J3K34DRAFT_424725 [Monoraphidium minutum]|nr:MAG: hypothetical protein J3K34DRAFT_424725 [Monoraphidium minutum]
MVSEQAMGMGGGGYGGGVGPQQPGAYGGGGGGGGGGGAMHLFPPHIKTMVEDMCDRHSPYLQRHHFDESAVSMLMRLGETDAVAVLGELDTTRLESVRSMPAFIMGCVKRYMARNG